MSVAFELAASEWHKTATDILKNVRFDSSTDKLCRFSLSVSELTPFVRFVDLRTPDGIFALRANHVTKVGERREHRPDLQGQRQLREGSVCLLRSWVHVA